MGYTSQDTINILQEFVRKLFESNAILDNIAYALKTDLNYPILSDNIHHRIAHSYGKQADIITDFLDLRNDRVVRGDEFVEPKLYSNVLDCLSDIINVQNELESLLKKSIVTSSDNLDFAVEDTLREYYKNDVVMYTKQAHKLYDTAVKYSEDGLLPLFDSDCEKYFIVNIVD